MAVIELGAAVKQLRPPPAAGQPAIEPPPAAPPATQ
jgi:hypothetical protein